MADAADPLPAPRAFGTRKILIVAGAAAGLLIAGAAVLQTSMAGSSARLQRMFIERMQETAGLRATVRGEGAFAFLPRPHIDVMDVDMADDDGAVRLTAATARVDLRWLSLLSGTPDIAAVRFVRPRIEIAADKVARLRAGALANASKAAGRYVLGPIDLADGEIVLTRPGRSDVGLRSVNARLDWRAPAASASLAATFLVEGEMERVDAWLAAPDELLGGGTSPIQIRAAGQPFDATVLGIVDTRGGITLKGHADARAAELRVPLQALGLAGAAMPQLGPCSVDTDVAIDATGATLSALRLHLAGNDLEGSLALAPGLERPSLAGTLAAATLDFDPLVATFPPARTGTGDWSTSALDVGGLDLADVDLRISTGHTQVAQTAIDDAALSLMVRSRALDLNLAQGRIESGAVKGRLTVTPDEGGLDVQASGTFSGTEFAALARRGFAGRLAGTFAFASSGLTVAALVAGAHGRSDVTVGSGRLAGIDFEQNLRRLDKSEGAMRVRMGGATTFDHARIEVDVAAGVARLEQALFVGPGARLSIGGAVDLAARTFDLAGVATRAGTDGSAMAETPRLDLHLGGGWSAPSLTFTATPTGDAGAPADGAP